MGESMAFTTWAALKAQMLDDMANRDSWVGSYNTPDGRKLEYRSFEDWQKHYTFVVAQAEAEAAVTGVSSRKVSAIPQSDTW